jgi:hypothetical protein
MSRLQDSLDAIGRRYRGSMAGVSILIGAVGVGYLWAALFGDGLRGGKTGAALDNSSTYPNANAAILGVGVLLVASLFVWGSAGPKGARGPKDMLVWAASAAVVGLCLFGVSRLFI